MCGRKGRTHAHHRSRPLSNWMQSTAFETPRSLISRRAVRTDGITLKTIEGLATFSALPVIADWRAGLARRAGVSKSSRQLGEAQQSARVLESTPAIHEHKDGEYAIP